MFVDQVVAPHRLRAVSSVGEAFLLHCTANGKAFLASMSPQDLARATAGPLPRLTSHTITDPAVLLEELDQVRAEGVAYDREENSEGICAVGMILEASRAGPGRERPAACPAVLRPGRAARGR